MSPTYELALQTGKVIEQMGKFYPEVQLMYAIRGNKREPFVFQARFMLCIYTMLLSVMNYFHVSSYAGHSKSVLKSELMI